MSENLETILAAAQQLPPEELQQLIELLLSNVSTELREILEAEQQIRRGEVVPWSEIKRRHQL